MAPEDLAVPTLRPSLAPGALPDGGWQAVPGVRLHLGGLRNPPPHAIWLPTSATASVPPGCLYRRNATSEEDSARFVSAIPSMTSWSFADGSDFGEERDSMSVAGYGGSTSVRQGSVLEIHASSSTGTAN